MPATLVLCRHGQSDWNLKNLFTGWRDPDLTDKGIDEARAAGRRLKALGLVFDIAFTSVLVRAQHTTRLMEANAAAGARGCEGPVIYRGRGRIRAGGLRVPEADAGMGNGF